MKYLHFLAVFGEGQAAATAHTDGAGLRQTGGSLHGVRVSLLPRASLSEPRARKVASTQASGESGYRTWPTKCGTLMRGPGFTGHSWRCGIWMRLCAGKSPGAAHWPASPQGDTGIQSRGRVEGHRQCPSTTCPVRTQLSLPPNLGTAWVTIPQTGLPRSAKAPLPLHREAARSRGPRSHGQLEAD